MTQQLAGGTDGGGEPAPTPTPTPSPPPFAAYPPDPTEPAAPAAPVADGGVSQTLLQLLRLSPLTDLYRSSADKARPFREWACFWADAALRAVVYVFLLLVLATVAVKVLSPIPDLWPF